MANPIKRLNYFNGQFLRAPDFIDEQTYHLEMGRRHNQKLHTWGIADGLKLQYTIGSSQIEIAEGMAIDSEGREIVLVEKFKRDLSTFLGKTVYITIVYEDELVDKTNETGVEGFTRVQETPTINISENPPSADQLSLQLILGRVTVNTEGKITATDEGEGVNRRRAAGVVAGDLEARSLTLTDPNIDPSQWSQMRLGAAGQADLQSNLRVHGKLEVTGIIQGELANGSVSTNELANGAVTVDKLADNSVNAAKIVDGTVGTAELANGSVTLDKLADNSVNAAKIVDGTVGTAELANGSVTLDKLADNSVNAAKIIDGEVGTAELANGSVTVDKLADNSVTAAKIIDGEVGTAELANGSVTVDKLADNSVTAAKIVDGEVGTAELANGSVTVDKLADNSVTAAKIVDGEVGTNELADDNITENKLAPPLKNKLQDLKEMQYRHNLNLHTFGVAGDGLVVRFANDQTNTPWTPDLTSVELRVSPGIAIDNTGREILQPDPVSYILTIPQTTSSISTFLTIRWDEATQSPIFQDIVSPPQDGSVIILAQVYGYQGEGFFVGDYLRQVASARVSLVKQKVSIEVQGEGLQQALNTNSNSNSQASYTQSNGIINSANASSGQSSAYSSGLSNSVSASANQSSATTYGIYNSSSASGQSSAYSQGLTSYSYASSSQQNAYTTSYGIYASSSAYSPQANPNAASYGIYAESSGTNAKIYGIYTRAYNNGIPLYVEGKAVITGGVSSGHITDRFINRSGQRLRTGDVVKLKGTPIARFSGENNRIPLPEVILCDQENDSKVIGIVDSEAIPGPEVPDTRIGADDPTFIEDGGDLYVVILGTYAHCKVDATEAPIEVGDLLTSSNNPGHAKKATDPKLGTIIGKALEPLEKGTGYIAVFVNIQ